MSPQTTAWNPMQPCTLALAQVLPTLHDPRLAEDLLFLERWEISPLPGAATALRIHQLRRANPQLAEAIRAEVTGLRGKVGK